MFADELLFMHNLLPDYRLFATGNVALVEPSETPGSLWGEDKPDPKDALAKEGFQMRRVVLTPKVGKEPTKAEE
jgi:hypothetical protein